jgi:hypothetical protein
MPSAVGMSKNLHRSGLMQRGEQKIAAQSPRWPRAGSVIGISMPNDLAVVRWVTISEVVGCITELGCHLALKDMPATRVHCSGNCSILGIGFSPCTS